MTFKELKTTEEYKQSDILELYYDDGEEVCIVDFDKNNIDDNEVTAVNKSKTCIGLLEVILRR